MVKLKWRAWRRRCYKGIYRDARMLWIHGLLSILCWYSEKQVLSSSTWASGERSSDMTMSSPSTADGSNGERDAHDFSSSSTIWTPLSTTSGENCDSCCSGGIVRLSLAAKFDVAIRNLPVPKSSNSAALRLASYEGFQ